MAAVLLGALRAWVHRFDMVADGISYLDVADAYLRREWASAINPYWSPMYSWLLALAKAVFRPSAYWEYPLVHLVNFLVYLAALAAFSYLLRGVVEQQRRAAERYAPLVPISESGWIALGYTLFIWAGLNLVTIKAANPDMLVLIWVFLASGLLVRIRVLGPSTGRYALLGVVLAFGYFAKTAMFPLGFVFLFTGALAAGNLRKALWRAVLGLCIFVAISSIFIAAISLQRGRFTFGDSGSLNYAWWVNNATQYMHWRGDPPGSGVPAHPTRKLQDEPALYEYATPIKGTYPPWTDPSYWNQGLKPHFDLKRQIEILALSARFYYDLFLLWQAAIIGGALVVLLSHGSAQSALRRVADQCHLWFPAVAALGMYGLVWSESRYVASFVVVLWLGIFSAVWLPSEAGWRRMVHVAVLAIVVIQGAAIGHAIVFGAKGAESRQGNIPWRVARGLEEYGVHAGDQVAVIGDAFVHAYWARLGRLKIVSEIPQDDAAAFWAASPELKQHSLELFASTGARVVVTDAAPRTAGPDWKRIAGTGHYVYVLKH